MSLAPQDSLTELSREQVDLSRLRPKTDEDLARLLQEEFELAHSGQEDHADESADGLDYYLANQTYRKYTRVDGRATTSQVIDKTVAEVVDDTLPDLIRVALGNVNLVEFEATRKIDAMHVAAATMGVNQTLRRQEDLEHQIHDYIKNGLLQKIGVIEVQVLDAVETPERHEDMSLEEFYALRASVQDGRVVYEGPGSLPQTVNAVVYEQDPRRYLIRSIQPSDLFLARDATSTNQSSVDGARYVGVQQVMSVASAQLQWPEAADKFVLAAQMGYAAGGHDVDEAVSRFRELRGEAEDKFPEAGRSHNLLASNIRVMREYIRSDLDEDGFPELTLCIRVGKTIIHKEPVLNNMIATWSPYRIPDEVVGESVADKLMPLQDINTAFWRICNDAAAYATRPRVALNERSARTHDIPTMYDLMNWSPMAPIRVAGNPNEELMRIESPDVTSPALKVLDFNERLQERWSGISRRQRGLDPQSVSQESAKRHQDVVSTGSGRMEFLARCMAAGLRGIGSKMLEALIRHGEMLEIEYEEEQWVSVDPSQWSPKLNPVVHISGSAGSRQLEIEHLLQLYDVQLSLYEKFGPENPFVGIAEIAETVRELVDAYGFRDTKRLIKRPMPDKVRKFVEWMVSQENKDPAVIAAEIEAQSADKQIQAEAEKDKYRLDGDNAMKRVEIEAKSKIELAKIAAEKDIKLQELKEKRAEREMNERIARRKIEVEEKKIQAQKEQAAATRAAAAANQGGGDGASGTQ
ncbi:MAG: hypothetical protein OXC31_15615 [Spirochaetaceae bacterium]|nr:hypothetical protein [Spirochaetaceae bacterium]